MEWQVVFREGFGPVIGRYGLAVLLEALRRNDSRIIQQATTDPPPLLVNSDCPVSRADPVAFCGWQAIGLGTVGDLEEYFARICYEVDSRIGRPGGCRWFLNWVDDTPRGEMVARLVEEVEAYLSATDPAKTETKLCV